MMIDAGRSSGVSAKWMSRWRFRAWTERCNVVFTYQAGTSSTSICLAKIARVSANSRFICA
jgi:hypothetical protein